MSESLGLILSTVALVISLSFFFAVMELLFPARLARIRDVAAAQPGRSLIVGAVNMLFFTSIALTIIAAADAVGVELLALPGLIIGLLLALALLFGLSAVVQMIGDRLGADRSRLSRSLLGGLSLTLASMLPFVGWFFLLPYVAFLGIGALIITFLRSR